MVTVTASSPLCSEITNDGPVKPGSTESGGFSSVPTADNFVIFIFRFSLSRTRTKPIILKPDEANIFSPSELESNQTDMGCVSANRNWTHKNIGSVLWWTVSCIFFFPWSRLCEGNISCKALHRSASTGLHQRRLENDLKTALQVLVLGRSQVHFTCEVAEAFQREEM